MRIRLFALFLVVLLLWSGFMPGERGMSTATAGVAQVEAHAPSMGDLAKPTPAAQVNAHLADDLPVQGHAEPLADLQAVLMDRTSAPATGLTMVRPRPYAALARLAPYLDGLQRPPCATPFVA